MINNNLFVVWMLVVGIPLVTSKSSCAFKCRGQLCSVNPRCQGIYQWTRTQSLQARIKGQLFGPTQIAIPMGVASVKLLNHKPVEENICTFFIHEFTNVLRVFTSSGSPRSVYCENADIMPDHVVPDKTSMPDHVVPDKTSMPDHVVPDKTSMPDHVVPDKTSMPDHVVPDKTSMPDHVVPDKTIPGVNIDDAGADIMLSGPVVSDKTSLDAEEERESGALDTEDVLIISISIPVSIVIVVAIAIAKWALRNNNGNNNDIEMQHIEMSPMPPSPQSPPATPELRRTQSVPDLSPHAPVVMPCLTPPPRRSQRQRRPPDYFY